MYISNELTRSSDSTYFYQNVSKTQNNMNIPEQNFQCLLFRSNFYVYKLILHSRPCYNFVIRVQRIWFSPGQNYTLNYTSVCSFSVLQLGRAIAQTVSRWLPTAAARVRARVWSCGICGGQSGAVAGFLRVLRFPLPIFIPPIAPQSPSSIIWGLYNRPEVAAVPRVLVLPH
jgi:hypothetical protein